MNHWKEGVGLGTKTKNCCQLKESLERTKTYGKVLQSVQDSLSYDKNMINLETIK